MMRRTLAAVLIAAILGAQPGVEVFAGETAKFVASAPLGSGAAGSPSQLPSLKIDDSKGVPGLPSLPRSDVPGLPDTYKATGASVAEGLHSRSPQTQNQTPETRAQDVAGHPLAAAIGQNLFATPPLEAAAQAPGAHALKTPVLRGLTALAAFFAPKKSLGQTLHEDELRKAFDGLAPTTKIFLTQQGADPIETTVADLPAALAAHPGYESAMLRKGRIRLVLGKGSEYRLNEKDAIGVGDTLAKAGLAAPLSVERIQIAPVNKAEAASVQDGAAISAKPEPLWKRAALAAPRELTYLARTLRSSISRPTLSELIGGVVSKGPAFAMSMAWWAKLMLPGQHYVAFAAASLFSFTLETFHGVFINTWQNVQNFIGRQRGVAYQTFFNLAYMQLTAALARVITWSAIPTTIAPWQGKYWRDMGIVTLVGTFIGTLGYQGLNDLYNKGLVSRRTRSFIQQGRDLFFLLGGVFFASGSMGIYWPLFLAQQSLDVTLFLVSHFAKARPLVFVAEQAVAASAEFRGMYPVTPGPRLSPLRQALGALINNPLTQLLSWPLRWGYKKWKAARK